MITRLKSFEHLAFGVVCVCECIYIYIYHILIDIYCNILEKCFILQHAACGKTGLLPSCASLTNAFGPRLEASKQLRKCFWSAVTKTRRF